MTGKQLRMPDVGEGLASAEIIRWLVQIGDQVKEDQPLVLVETDKAQVEIPAPVSGTVTGRRGAEGDLVKVGELLVVIDEGAPDGSSAAASAAGAMAPRHVLASPYTRRMAAERGIDLSTVTGTGPHGRVQLADLDATTAEPTVATTPSPAAPRARDENVVIQLRGVRRRVAQSMTQSLQVPHIFEFREVDATALLAVHTVLKEELQREGVRFSPLPLLMMATIRALLRHPNFNAAYDDKREQITQFPAVHLGMATATEDGLIVPVLHDADRLSARELAQAIGHAADRARRRQASVEELSGASFTVTNFGSYGTWLGMPIIRPPEVGIAGFGRISEKVLAVDGRPEVRPVLPLVVAADHRVNDGAHLGAFVTELARVIAQPALLLIQPGAR